LICSLPKNVTTFHEEKDGIIHFCLSPYKMGNFGTLNLYFFKKKWIFLNSIFQLHPIISPVILDQMACFLPKTNTKFHQLFKYVKKDAIFSSIRWENGRNIFGWRSLLGTVQLAWVCILGVPYFMSRKMQLFHQLDEKITETFLADFSPDWLYSAAISGFGNTYLNSGFSLIIDLKCLLMTVLILAKRGLKSNTPTTLSDFNPFCFFIRTSFLLFFLIQLLSSKF